MSTFSTDYDVIIIGAGAAGMMCAIEAGKRGRRVLLLEKANKVGKKILISGGGRCNFTNLYASAEDYISHNPHFCKSALSRYTQWDFIALLERHKLSWNEKTLGQLFCDQKARAIVDMLVDECEQAGVTTLLGRSVKSLVHDEAKHHFQLEVQTGGDAKTQTYTSEAVVVATGGPSIPKMGASDYALRVARQFGLDVVPFIPALVPFTFGENDLEGFIKTLSGLAVFVELGLIKQPKKWQKGGGVPIKQNKNTPLASTSPTFKENILFTHRGISGPAALQISSYWELGDSLTINLLPDTNAQDWLLQQQQEHPQAELKTVLNYKLPKRLVTVLGEELIQPEYIRTPLCQLTANDLEVIINCLLNWQLTPNGTEGLRTAEVALGGVDTHALSSKTFEAKKQKGLFFVGEAIDVTGHLGGFNFQWAWASGWCAGQVV